MQLKPNFIAIVWILSSVVLCGCNQSANTPVAKDKRLNIVCTTTMIEDLLQNLVGDKARVTGIMRAGEDPHIYNVRPRDAEQISQADLVFTNGYHLESTLEKVIRNNASGPVIALAEEAVSTPLGSIEGNATAPDPHCWMSVPYFRGYLQQALRSLESIDPENAAIYRLNAQQYDAKLQALDRWIKDRFASIPSEQRVIVTSHDAFQYLAAAYGLDVRAMIGISTAEAPRPQEIEKIEALIQNRNVQALFIETSTSSTLNRLVEKSAAATGASIGGTLYSDSLDAPGTPAGSYIGMMRHNVTAIADALGQPSSAREGASNL